eukprot:CAMPEP_0167753974 /NCGR_PEP_ID=MMETSP0110_2-20121227/8012_1 /TAXON_ID=629695 /ORGANISM="Gymnochlora sp., Strain CCMP2014" /LENGTH=197 /DNA_ID=CAMNT_0007639801 /DNA_START=86 /DNA_END=676 /DNA_ORIENTATION=-
MVDSNGKELQSSKPSMKEYARSSVGLDRKNWLAPYVITKPNYITEILSMAKISSSDVFYDIGCGTGHVLCHVAKHTSAQKVVGIEHNKDLVQSCKDTIKEQGLDKKRVTVEHQDAMKADLSQATVAYLYLTIEGMKKFETQLHRMLKRGVRVVSMWPRQCKEEDRKIAKESIRHFNPQTGTFSNAKTHPFGLKIYLW